MQPGALARGPRYACPSLLSLARYSLTRWLITHLALVLSLVLAGVARPAMADPEKKARKLDLKQLWAQALRRFPSLEAARHAVDGAVAQRTELIGMALPSGELNAFLSWLPSGTRCSDDFYLQAVDQSGNPVKRVKAGPDLCVQTEGVTFNPQRDGLTPYLLGPDSKPLFRLDARLTQPMFTFGKLKAGIELGQVGVDMARANQQISQADLAVNLVRAYYGLKAARAALEIVKEGHEQISAWLKRIDADLDKGKGSYTEVDLMRMKVADSQVELIEIDLERTIQWTHRALRYLAQDPEVDIDDGDLEVQGNESRDLDYYLDMAMLRRPELRLLDLTGKGAKLYRDLRIAELLPDIGLVINFSYQYAGGIEDTNHAFQQRYNYIGVGVGLGLRMPLDFGPRAARLQKAMADLRQYQARRREAIGGGIVELERSYRDLQEAQRRLKAAEVAERRARGWLQGIKQNMDVGTAESRDMIDALRAYFEQRLLVLRAINDVNTMTAVVRRQAGLPIIEG